MCFFKIEFNETNKNLEMSLFTKESITNNFNNAINIVRKFNNENVEDTIKILRSFYQLLFNEDMIVESCLRDINIHVF